MLFHSLFENFQEIMEAGTTFRKRIAHNLNQKWHELVGYLCEENSSFIA
jgi:hypothetical protein